MGLCWLFASWMALAQPVVQTEAEREWLGSHPVLKMGLTREFAPFYLRDETSKNLHGYVLELLNLWSQRLGVRFEYVHYDNLAQVRDALRRGDIDAAPFVPQDVSEPDDLVATRPVFTSALVLAARRDVPDTSATADFAGRRLAVESGSVIEQTLRRRYPRAQLMPYPSTEAALRAVASGLADIVVGYQQSIVYQVERQLLANVELRRSLGLAPMVALVDADDTALHNLLERLIAETSSRDRERLGERWLPQASTRIPLPAASALLSSPEEQWVQAHGRIRVGYDPSFAPVTLRGELDEFKGYGADLIRLLARKSGLVIESEVGSAFADIYERGVQGRLDVVVGMARTAARRADYDFVGPFLSVPTVLFTRPEDVLKVTEARDIGAHRLALLRGHFLIPELRVRMPALQMLELDRQDQVLAAVAEGAADVGLGNLLVVNDLIEARFTGRVAVSGVVRDGDSELYLGVPRQSPELTRVLARAMEAVNDSETAELRARWLAREVPGGLSWSEVARVAGPVFGALLLLALALWFGKRRLRRAHDAEREARQVAEESIAARGRFLAYLSHELRGTLGAVSSGAELLKTTDDPTLRERLMSAIAQSASGLLALLEQTLRYERSLQTPMVLAPEKVDLAVWWHDTLSPARLSAQAKGLQFDERWHGAAPTAWLDPVRLQQVLQNLLNNAIKFTPEGRVEVSGCVQLQHGVSRLLIEVRDSGPGLSEADRAGLFEPYAQGVQGRRVHQGAGLGLAISQQIVQAMGGEIEATAPPEGWGACFVFSVPLPALPA